MSMELVVKDSGHLRPVPFAASATLWTAAIDPMVLREMRREAPIGKGPNAGELHAGIRSRRVISSRIVSSEIYTNVPHAKFVIDGTPPHQILARRANMLHFVGRDGSDVFRRSVNHPGTKPNPFPKRVVERTRMFVEAEFKRIMSEAAAGR